MQSRESFGDQSAALSLFLPVEVGTLSKAILFL